MKKNIFFGILVFLFSLNLIYASSEPLLSASSDSCDLDVSLINQDPYPAIPGEYVNVVFQVNGVASNQCDGATFELIPEYPFSLDDLDGLRVLDGSTYVKDYKSDWMITYKLRVDKDAVEGTSTLLVHYNPGKLNFNSYIEKKFDIEIQDSRTNFDAVIQESTSSEVSIAIANTGKYVANSVVVRIPEQDSFRVTGTDGQMVGNLDSGDYTIVNFALTKIPVKNNEDNNLKFDIYYTDSLGFRRTVNMQLPMNSGLTDSVDNTLTYQEFGNRKIPGQGTSNIYLTFAIILVVLIIFGVIYKKKSKKIKNIFKKMRYKSNKHKQNSNEPPSWIEHQKEGERKK
ncbi:hypothetical protein J4438_03070 [Candidatus Woesearchaeota archaeon]|nr:hypothetical protein [Candidatus Woesearchaeota archaeon]